MKGNHAFYADSSLESKAENDSDCDDYAGTFEEICRELSFGMLWKVGTELGKKKEADLPVTSALAFISVLPWRINDDLY